ncbi:MAG: SUMF1/EgtB/PvdO family nonheme iron enzyme [Paludibacteraceae bacterium]|nr:SUMF1/EgtB/PvdO family nonheme iron enzyme [Paludibacteraceae bacterium]
MKLTKILPLAALLLAFVACNKPAGELVGAGNSGNFKEANPYGMIFIKKGSFMMGANTQSAIFGQEDNQLMATVEAFWMDETEITNDEYKQFVNWVRDSIALRHFIMNDVEGFALKPKNMPDEEYDALPKEKLPIDWSKASKIPWKTWKMVEEDGIRLSLDSMFYSDGTLKTNFLHYRYSWVNYDEAILQRNKFDVATSRYPAGASVRVDTSWVSKEDGGIYDSTIIRPLREPKDLITSKIICVYPDTLVWIRDFQHSFNDPMMHKYFSHPGYADYPVVGITWEQAHAFCDWRTKFFNAHSKYGAQDYRLPTEAQWEYAARGGRKMAMYPWGGNYARDAKGCFFANFKPYRGGYNDDTGTTTMKVAQFRPNDFGLFDMGGNVAEWTCSAFLNSSNTVVHDLNPDYEYMARKSDPDNLKRKVVKGGSWKDISYYMQCGVRTYEYQYESRPYIGFRCVRAYIGD